MKRSAMVGVLLAITATLPSPTSAAILDPGSSTAQVPCIDPRGCPDLLVDPSTMSPSTHLKEFKPQDCQVQEGATEAGVRRVLRFTYTTPNLGDGDLVVGRPEDHPEWFEWGECHGHHHFKQYAEYRLWTPAQFDEYKAIRDANPDALASEILAQNPQLQPVLGEKRAFCVMDLVYNFQRGHNMYRPGPPKFLTCRFQGISVGWADEYGDFLDSQFIDVTDVAPGSYVLEAEVNSDRLFLESNYRNNWTSIEVTL